VDEKKCLVVARRFPIVCLKKIEFDDNRMNHHYYRLDIQMNREDYYGKKELVLLEFVEKDLKE
jgi:hypothetical protein